MVFQSQTSKDLTLEEMPILEACEENDRSPGEFADFSHLYTRSEPASAAKLKQYILGYYSSEEVSALYPMYRLAYGLKTTLTRKEQIALDRKMMIRPTST